MRHKPLEASFCLQWPTTADVRRSGRERRSKIQQLFLQNFCTTFYQVRLLGLRRPDRDFIISTVRHCGLLAPGGLTLQLPHRSSNYFLLFLLFISQQRREKERSLKLGQAFHAAAPLPSSDDRVLSLWSLSLCPKVASGVSGIYTNTTYLIPIPY